MGGQACVFYGAAEFSRDLDLLILADAGSLARVDAALTELQAQGIAVPPFRQEFLDRGHAVHFRCRAEEVSGLRIDLMSRLRGLPGFAALWDRRTTIEVEGTQIDLLSIPDLVRAKKTQRDKDWPMIRRLLERAYFELPENPSPADVSFLLRELRTAELLGELVQRFPALASEVANERAATRAALDGDENGILAALGSEETQEREADRAYWAPLKSELEALRRSR